MLIAKDINIGYRNVSLIEHGSLTIGPSIYGLTAPNGTGKTTLLRTIAGLYPLQSGTVYLEDEDGKGKLTETAQKDKFFYFESTNWLDGNLSARDYLTFVSRTWKGSQELIAEANDFWLLDSFWNKLIRRYSLGMRQKTLLALYFVSNTQYWLLDEPTLGLDQQSQVLFRRFMQAAKKRGVAILFTSHQKENMLSIADAVYVLANKRLSLQTVERAGREGDA